MKKVIAILLIVLTLFSFIPVVTQAATGAEITSGVPFDSKYYKKTCPKKGTITKYYLDGNKNRSVYVWKPYNYNANTKYEVVVLMHGTGDNASSWLQTKHSVWGKKINGQNIFDWMAYDNVCKPFIVVTFNSGYNSLFPNNEIIKVMKIAAQHYNTYLGNGSDESITAYREHVIVGGLSRGSGNSYQFAAEHPEYVGNLICMSGSRCLEELKASLTKSNLKINKLFIACGKNDSKYLKGSKNQFKGLSSEAYTNSSRLVLYKSMAHDWRTWYAGIYDGLKFIIPR